MRALMPLASLCLTSLALLTYALPIQHAFSTDQRSKCTLPLLESGQHHTEPELHFAGLCYFDFHSKSSASSLAHTPLSCWSFSLSILVSFWCMLLQPSLSTNLHFATVFNERPTTHPTPYALIALQAAAASTSEACFFNCLL